MPVWTGAALIAVVGMGALTGMTVAPKEQTQLVAALVPPWAEGGFAASAGLAVVDIRWHGHVVILDTGGDPAALARLRARGYWLLDATVLRGCGKKETGK